MKTTNIIFFDKKIKMKFIDDNYSVIADQNIKAGTLLLIEHPLQSESMIDIMCNIICDPSLNKSLYPRNTIVSSKCDLSIGQKLEKNVFKFGKNYILGNMFSKINHSCKPNCHMSEVDHVNDQIYYGLWSTQDIIANEEINIDYCQTDDVKFHKSMSRYHNFKCDCTIDYIQKKNVIVKNRVDLCHKYKIDKPIIKYHVDKYMDSINFSNIMKNRILAQKTYKDSIIMKS